MFALIRPMHAARTVGGRAGRHATGSQCSERRCITPVIEFSARRARPVSPPPMSLEFQLMTCSTVGFQTVPARRGGTPVHNLASVILNEGRLSWVIGEWVMGGKYSAEWWEKIAELKRDLPAQDPVSVVDHLIQATAHGARTPAKNGKPSGQNPAASKRERSLAD